MQHEETNPPRIHLPEFGKATAPVGSSLRVEFVPFRTTAPPSASRNEGRAAMPTERAILKELTSDDLRSWVDYYELDVTNRRVKDQLVAALVGSEDVSVTDVLQDQYRATLKRLCRKFDLDDSGKKKADIVARLLETDDEWSANGGQGTEKRRGKDRKTNRRGNTAAQTGGNGATTGYEAELWGMADALRSSMDAAEYKHIVLGLIFLKYISDAFEERREAVHAEWGEEAAEDRDEYIAENVFWVPQEARWNELKAKAKRPTIGELVDDAMSAIERENPTLKGVLPKDYARPALDKQRLGQLIDLVSNIKVGDAEARSKDVLGRVYEYFLSQFASAEGKKGGEFYTPRCVVKLLVEMLEPYQGRVYDPCCGSSGMFVQSMEFIHAHANGNGNGADTERGKKGDIRILGQESNYTTWRLAKMNLAIRGINGQIEHGDTLRNDRFPDLKADFILANPPFNISDWGGDRLKNDKRWEYGVPPAGNANFAWVQHMVHHLAPRGVAGFVPGPIFPGR